MLHVNEQLVEETKRLFKLVQSKNGVQGRKTSHVIISCLYIMCRQNETGHLMIDFAEVLNINVFQLNKIYLKLIKLLHFEIKKNDPSLYVPRFLKALKFDQDKEKEILEFVLKLLAKMRRNWLAKGRRPSGLIAACFYIACRCFNIQKSYKEISKILKGYP